MINLAKLEYRVAVISSEGEQLDVTGITSGLGWSEGEKELSAKISCKFACVEVGGKMIDEIVQPMTPIIIYAGDGEDFAEVIRGNVTKVELTEANSEFVLSVECADECHALRHNMDDFFFTDGHSSNAILEDVLKEAGAEYRIEIKDGTHGKKVYRQKYYSDMIADVLKDLKEKGGGEYFIRAREGVIEIIPRGTNETIYHFDIDDNVVRVKESFDASKVVTKVKVVGKEKSEGHQAVEAVVEGNTELGTRQVIYRRKDKETLAEAEAAAKKILDENGVQRKTSLEAPDVPTLRKGDKIRVRSSVGENYFFVKSIRHDAPQMKMTMELDTAESEYEIAKTDESTESAP